MNSRGYFGTAILATVFAHTTVLADDNRVSSVVAKEQHSAAMSNFSIPAGDLQSALLNFSQQVDLQLLYASDLTAGITTQGIQGEYHPQAALELLLAGTGLTYRFTNEHTVTLEKAGESTLPAVEVSANAVPASEQLPMPFNGGQVADGVRLGILGNTDILDAPFSITSYTSKTIEDQQARSVLDVLANQPSVRSASARSNINEDFILRGFPVESQDIALNGMYALMPYFRVPVEMAERVEVFEGPSALLSGMSPGGNIGGSINIVPKRAGDRPVNRFTAQYFSDSVLGGHLDIGRRFGENDEFGARVNGMYRTGDTTVDYQSEEDKLGSVALDYQGDRLRLSADLIYQKQNIDGVVRQFTIAPTVTNLPSPPEGTLSYPGSWTDLAMEDSSGVFRAEFDLSSAVTLYAGAGARTSKMDAVAGNPEITGNFGSYTYAPAWQLFDVDSRSYEAGMNSRFATGFVTHQLNISATQVRQNQSLFFYTGFPFQDGTITTSNDTPAPDLAGITVDKNKYVDTKLTSYAIADTLGFMDEKVKLTVGIRQQQVQVQNFNFLTGAPSGDAYDESKPTPVVGLVLKPWSETVSLYASYVEGLSQGPTAPLDPTLTNPGEVFEPTVSKQFEIGAKAEWNSLGGSVAIYHLEKPSGIRVGNTFEVSGEQTHKGVELNLYGEITPAIRLLGGASYIDSEMATTTEGINQGRSAIGVPEFQLNLGGEWDTPLINHLTLTSRIIYTGEQYADQSGRIELPHWTRVDIGARYTTKAAGKPLVLRANLENLFNESSWGVSNAGYLYVGDARSLQLSATIDF